MKQEKGPVTAEELMRQLEADPEYQRRMKEREARAAELQRQFKLAERPLIEALREIGVEVDSIGQLASQYRRIPRQIVELLLDWLPKVENEGVREWVIRTLTNPAEPFDGQPLIDAFERVQNDSFRWAVANTIAEARPTGISEWLLSAARNPSYGRAREMLMLALARLAPKEKATPMLLSLFQEFPGHVADALAEVGGPEELAFLREVPPDKMAWVRKAVARAIRKIERRITP